MKDLKAPVFATLGCRLNAYETEAMKEMAEAAGLSGAVVVNTCAVTAEAVRAPRPLPHYDSSAMDGWAVRGPWPSAALVIRMRAQCRWRFAPAWSAQSWGNCPAARAKADRPARSGPGTDPEAAALCAAPQGDNLRA